MSVKKTHWLRTTIIVLVICGIAGLALTSVLFFGNPDPTYASATLEFTFEGAAEGVAPNGNRFDMSGIASDEVLNAAAGGNSDYADYNVRGIDHRLSMGFLWTWPWDTSVRLNVTERIPRIDGRVKGTRAEELIARDGPNAVYPPEWPDAMYRVSLYRENGQWKIRNLTRIGE